MQLSIFVAIVLRAEHSVVCDDTRGRTKYVAKLVGIDDWMWHILTEKNSN